MNNHITTNTTTPRRRLIALAAILAVGAGASVAGLPAADAEAQEYRTTFYENVTKQPDYVITHAEHRQVHWFDVAITNRGGPAKSASWLSVRDEHWRIVDWLYVPALASNEVYWDTVAAEGNVVCADAWENYVEESHEFNNCGESW